MADALFVRIDGIDYELVKTASRKGDKCLDCDLSCGDGKCGATRLPWTVCMALSIADENNDFVFRKKTFASFTVDGSRPVLKNKNKRKNRKKNAEFQTTANTIRTVEFQTTR